MTEETAPISTETNETVNDSVETAETTQEASEAEPETFNTEYVKGLRKESAGYRERAKTAETRVEELAKQLFAARVTATGRLADATDLQFDADLDSPEAINTAIDALLEAKPHLAARKPTGDIGQGHRGAAPVPFNLLETMKARI